MGAVIALAAACGFLFYQVNELKGQIAENKESLSAEIEKIHETSSVTVQTSKRNIEAMQKDVAKYRAQAAQLSGEAKAAANKHADELAAKLEQAQAEQGKKVAAVSADVSHVKEEAAATSSKVGEVTTEVGSLKTETATNKSAIEKTIADLKSAKGDLGVQSGLIATNGKELAALRQLGERNYIEFKLAKPKGKNAPQKVGDIQVVLEKTDRKKNTFDIKIIADDKTFDKPKSTVLVPVQFVLSKSVQPYELVVLDVKDNLISGYLSVPKVLQTRGSSN
jgi:chromosome segregation ATPase